MSGLYNILVCDDDKDIVNALEIYLKQDGYSVYRAYDGKGALRLLEEADIHLMILDIMMPGLDGLMTTGSYPSSAAIYPDPSGFSSFSHSTFL